MEISSFGVAMLIVLKYRFSVALEAPLFLQQSFARSEAGNQ